MEGFKYHERDENKMEESFVSSSDLMGGIHSPCKTCIKSLYSSVACRYIYIFLAAYSLALGVWALIDLIKGRKPMLIFYILESVINFLLLLDVLMRLFVKGCRSYWRQKTNILEFILVLVCVTFTALSTIEIKGLEKNIDELLNVILMISLCVFQYVRIAFIVAKQHQTAVSQILKCIGENKARS